MSVVDMWATIDLDLTTAKDRVRLLKAGFTKNYPKRIESGSQDDKDL